MHSKTQNVCSRSHLVSTQNCPLISREKQRDLREKQRDLRAKAGTLLILAPFTRLRHFLNRQTSSMMENLRRKRRMSTVSCSTTWSPMINTLFNMDAASSVIGWVECTWRTSYLAKLPILQHRPYCFFVEAFLVLSSQGVIGRLSGRIWEY